MIKVGITGQSGFIGSHLFNHLKNKQNIQLINFEDNSFENNDRLKEFVSQCDTIVHLAALNRHNDKKVIYDVNIQLVELLIESIKEVGNKIHVIFSSSTQEELENEYGKSKKIGREKLIDVANIDVIDFSGLLIPNVFGPFGKPFYNTFISTFSHQIINNEIPTIIVDQVVSLIYVQNLVEEIYRIIVEKKFNDKIVIQQDTNAKVTEILTKLMEYRDLYLLKGCFPNISDHFELNLFNTFRSYLNSDYFPRKLILNSDNRGQFVEVVKTIGQGQFSFSTTKPGVTRGNHYHTRKVERFTVIQGKALIQLRKIGTNEIINYELDGSEPAYVDMPIFYTHNIKNIGDYDLLTLFWINEFYNPEDPDTFFEEV